MSRSRSFAQSVLPFAIPALIASIAGWHVWSTDSFSGRKGAMDHPGDAVSQSDQSNRHRLIESEVFSQNLPPAPIMEPAVNDGRVKSILEAYENHGKTVSVESVRQLVNAGLGADTVIGFDGFQLSGRVVARQETDGICQMAVDLSDGLGRFQLAHRGDGKAIGLVFFTNEQLAFRFHGQPQNDSWMLERTSVAEVMCAKPGSTYPMAAASAMPKARKTAAAPASRDPDADSGPKTTVALSSQSESSYVIYIDFDGEKISHPWWTGDVILDAEPHERAFDEKFVTRVWRRVSEDFAAFDINVTTDRRVFDAAAIERRVMVIVTPNSAVAPGTGGVAYLTTFGMNIPCWAFNPDEGSCADTISHEVGHTLGLLHDGKIDVDEYYGGHGTGKTSWAPIMGAYFAEFEPPFVDEEVTQWSKGEYPDATNQEDDLEIITTFNGFSYRRDDHGNHSEKASDLSIRSGVVADSGIISTSNDSDWFMFSTSGGQVFIQADVLDVHSPDHDPGGANLAADLAIIDSRGDIVARSDQRNELNASVDTLLRSGTYYLRVRGGARGTLADGFSRYSSLGQYSLAGSVPQANVVRVSPGEIELTADAQPSDFNVSVRGEWRISKDADWIILPGPNKRSGNLKVSFNVTRNSNKQARSGIITIHSGPHVARVHVKQSGWTGYDDHADNFAEATQVEQDSTTPGEIEVGGDVDVFRVEVTDAGYLNVRASGGLDTFGSLYDAAGRRLASNDNRYGNNFGIRQLVTDGTYYVKVSTVEDGGLGNYQLIAGFESAPVFTVSDVKTLAGPSGGNYSFDIYANGSWSWETDVPWITSAMPPSQGNGALFGFTVDANTSPTSREGTITIFNDTMRLTHLVTQTAASADDHGNTMDDASSLPEGRPAIGRIDYEADVDVFRFSTRKSGLLRIDSLPGQDLKARLLDSRGELLTSSDDAATSAFSIHQEVVAGDYFLEVRHFSPHAVGDYRVIATLAPSKLVDLDYRAGKGGHVRGPRVQTIPFAADARAVTAVPRSGYRFLGWSDGVKTPRREDRKVISHLKAEALFGPMASLSAKGLRHDKAAARYELPFGTLRNGQRSVKMVSFKNTGNTVLDGFRVLPLSGDLEVWKVQASRSGKLLPGRSIKMRVLCSPSGQQGRVSARFKISARGLAGDIILEATAQLGTRRAAKQQQAREAVLGGPSMPKSPADALPTAIPQPWIDVSADGYFRYRFSRPVAQDEEAYFEISINGVDWEEALVLDVWKTGVSPDSNHFEAIIAPPSIAVPRVLVNEIPAVSVHNDQ